VREEQPLPFEPPRRLLVDDEAHAVVVDEDDPDWLALTTLRILRNGLKFAVAGEGTTFLHGGSVCIDGSVLLMCGRSRSGKTSTMLTSLSADGARYLSNDDVTIVERDGELLASGWPRSICLRRDSIEGFRSSGIDVPDLLAREHLWHPSNRHPGNWDELINGLPENVWVLPGELAHMFDAGTVVGARPDAIVFPTFDDDCTTTSVLEPLDADEAAASTESNREPVASHFDDFISPWFDPEEPARPLVDRIAGLPAFRLRQTLGSLRSSRDQLVALAGSLHA
jgi:hypothetical protein